MKPEDIRTGIDLVTAEERRALREELERRNRLRKEGQLPQLDIGSELEKSIAHLANDKFEDELDPYLAEAFRQVPERKGVIGSMIRQNEAYRRAESRLCDEKGLVRGNTGGRRRSSHFFALR